MYNIVKIGLSRVHFFAQWGPPKQNLKSSRVCYDTSVEDFQSFFCGVLYFSDLLKTNFSLGIFG